MEVFRASLTSAETNPTPEIQYYPALAESDGSALVIFPGGGYQALADHEGAGYAQHFSEQGIHCFVVKYRLASEGYRHPCMLEDALAAIATIRGRASDWDLNPERIGVMGSSAGGHLAAHSMTAWRDYDSTVSLRPDFGVLCYPVICSDRHRHAGSYTGLLGENASQEAREAVSPDLLVHAASPPCFLWHTLEDEPVAMENSLAYANALRTFHIPFELHVYQRGQHGLGLGTDFDWAGDCLRWIRQLWTEGSPA